MNIWAEILPMPVGIALLVLGQAGVGPDVIQDWVPTTTSLVTAGILAWYVIYDVRVRTPAMQKMFQDELEKTRIANEKDRSNHQVIIEAMRAAFLVEQSELRKTFHTEQAAARLTFDTQMGELRGMAWQAMQSMRGAVHDVRDTANQLMRKGEVANAERNITPERTA